jgi:hypothetical protein
MQSKLGFLTLLFVCVHASRQPHASARYRTSAWMRSHREYLAEYLLTKKKKTVTSTTMLLSSTGDGSHFRPSWKQMRGGGSSSQALYKDSTAFTITKECDVPSLPLGTSVCVDLQQILAFTRASKRLPTMVVPQDSIMRCFRDGFDRSSPSSTRGLVAYPDGFVRPSFLGVLLYEAVLFAGSHLETLHVALRQVAKKWMMES